MHRPKSSDEPKGEQTGRKTRNSESDDTLVRRGGRRVYHNCGSGGGFGTKIRGKMPRWES